MARAGRQSRHGLTLPSGVVSTVRREYVYGAGDRVRQIVDSVSGTISHDYDLLDVSQRVGACLFSTIGWVSGEINVVSFTSCPSFGFFHDRLLEKRPIGWTFLILAARVDEGIQFVKRRIAHRD